jgi:hypothetical protein
MTGKCTHAITRRALLGGGAAVGALLALPGCAGGADDLGGLGGGALAGVGGAFSLADVMRRLLLVASQNAFARLSGPDEFWREHMAGLGLAKLTGGGSSALSRMLTSGPFKAQLEYQFARLAADAAKQVEPLITRAARTVMTRDATALLRRKPGAATEFLRKGMGSAVRDGVVSALTRSLRGSLDGELGDLIGLIDATGIDMDKITSSLGRDIEDAIWNEIAAEESAIRANPQATADLLLIRVFGSD